MVDRGRLSPDERDAVLGRLTFTQLFADLADVRIAIEAVPETLSLKTEIFTKLNETCAADAILASNTSSLSITEIGHGSGRAGHVVGMHFFNPPVLMKLIEVVRGEATAPDVVEATIALARAMGKTPVVCRDTPGFIVNRVARPYYLESLYMLGDGLADIPTMDAAMRGVGFPMGPFQLMDLIGVDVNFAVTSSVYQQRFYEPRFRPHPVQEGLVRAGRLGRKTGSGFYDYTTNPATPLVWRDARTASGPAFDWDRWQAHTPGPEVAPLVARTLAALVNEAYFALGEGVASEADIDAAMQLGTNYPRGLIAWGRDIGLELVLDTVLALEDWYRDGRHTPAPLLRQLVTTS
jgi:3-hydroxybutyryl-CoA dehydrogenase